MSPNLVGIIIGVVFILPTIYLFRVKKIEDRMWPFFLVTLPIYYMLFGLLVFDSSAILNELLYGLPFIVSGLMVWRISNRKALITIAIGWLAHGFYDYYHDFFFVNPGVFSWYPAFCAVVDICVGVYLLTQANHLLRTNEGTV